MTTANAPDRPAYRVPRAALASFAFDLVRGRERSFSRDAETVLRANRYPRSIEGLERVPRDGVFVLAMNHLSRRGLRPYHCAMVVSSAVSSVRSREGELRWAFTSEYQGRRVGPLPIPMWLIRWLFRRVALVYGFVVIPRREELIVGRAAALRQFERLLRGGSPVALTPEGAATGATGVLVEPPAGSGRFLLALTKRGAPIVPVAAFEDGTTLIVRFGAPFQLAAAQGEHGADADRVLRRDVMVSIARLLPPAYRGAYADVTPDTRRDEEGAASS
jgi:hypothetical protein